MKILSVSAWRNAAPVYFLGISTDHIFNVETTLKMAHQNVYDDISNAAAVRDALRGTMWEVK